MYEGTDPEPHETLLARVETGDAPALDALLVRHLPSLEAYVRLKAGAAVRARETLSDVVQSVCVEVLRDADRFEYRGEAEFRHWLQTHQPEWTLVRDQPNPRRPGVSAQRSTRFRAGADRVKVRAPSAAEQCIDVEQRFERT